MSWIVLGLNPGRGKGFLSFSKRPFRFRGHPASSSMKTGVWLSSERPGHELTTHFYLMSRLVMIGVIPLLTPVSLHL
jgi:hypothetical protein